MMNTKYEFTGETKIVYGRTLRRIKAIAAIGVTVAPGDIGGWIENENNLSAYGNAWVSDNAMAYGNAMVCGNARVCGNAMVYDNAMVCGDARVYDNARVCGDAEVYGNAIVYDNAMVCGHAMVCGDAWVYDNAMVCGNAMVYGNAIVYGDADVYGYAIVCGDARVYGNADYMTFKNSWSSGRWFTYTASNKKWKVGCFYGTGDELVSKAYADSELSGKCYEAIVRAVEDIQAAKKSEVKE